MGVRIARYRNPWAATKEGIQQYLRRRGMEVAPYLPGTGEAAMRAKLMRSRGVDLILDVGAHQGSYVVETKNAGWEGRAVSFEPISRVFKGLKDVAAEHPDQDWALRQHALGSADEQAEINVAQNLVSSSLLPMEERHQQSAPDSAYVTTETIEVRRLDSVWDEVVRDGETPFLKLDVQGFEHEVLNGAEASMGKLAGVQCELSIVPLYEGARLYREMIDRLDGLGFRLAGIEPGFADPDSGEMLQLDGVFVRA